MALPSCLVRAAWGRTDLPARDRPASRGRSPVWHAAGSAALSGREDPSSADACSASIARRASIPNPQPQCLSRSRRFISPSISKPSCGIGIRWTRIPRDSNAPKLHRVPRHRQVSRKKRVARSRSTGVAGRPSARSRNERTAILVSHVSGRQQRLGGAFRLLDQKRRVHQIQTPVWARSSCHAHR